MRIDFESGIGCCNSLAPSVVCVATSQPSVPGALSRVCHHCLLLCLPTSIAPNQLCVLLSDLIKVSARVVCVEL